MSGIRIAFCTLSFMTIATASAQMPQPGDMADPSGITTMDQACRDYAQAAVAQHQENVRLGCGFIGPRWSNDKEGHYQWCLGTKGSFAASENTARQNDLQSCRSKSLCHEYAKTAVQQQADNLQNACGYSGPRWSADFDHHYNWCVQGRNSDYAANETSQRKADLGRCAVRKPLDGDFTIKSVTPHYGGSGQNRFVQRIDIALEATSARSWIIGDYGHPRYGSLWAEVTVVNKIAPNNAIQTQKKTYLFSIRGIAAQTPSFITPHPGQQVGAGTHGVMLSVAPMPRPQLLGVEQMFSVPSAPFSPGQIGCWYSYPEVTVKVFVVTTANTATVRSASTGQVYDAVFKRVYLPKQGGFNTGVIYQRCR